MGPVYLSQGVLVYTDGNMTEAFQAKGRIVKGFQIIPGVGKAVAGDLYSLGYRSVADLKKEDPQKMYEKLCRQAGMHVDRCMLYTFRCAVYFAEGGRVAEKLKWWNWSDKNTKK